MKFRMEIFYWENYLRTLQSWWRWGSRLQVFNQIWKQNCRSIKKWNTSDFRRVPKFWPSPCFHQIFWRMKNIQRCDSLNFHYCTHTKGFGINFIINMKLQLFLLSLIKISKSFWNQIFGFLYMMVHISTAFSFVVQRKANLSDQCSTNIHSYF